MHPKLFYVRLILAAAAGAIFVSPTIAEDRPPKDDSMSAVAFLGGHWGVNNADGTYVEEAWTSASAGTMIGVGRTMKNGKTVFFEFLRMEKRGDDIFYIAMPRGKNATEFKLIEKGDKRAVFENKDNDFPQRIIYEMKGDALHARIEGNQNGKPKSQDWAYTRVKGTS